LQSPRRGGIDIGEGRHAANAWHCFDQDFLSLAVKLGGEDAETGCIAARLGKRGHKACSHQIGRIGQDWDGFRRLLCGANGCIARGNDDIDLCINKLCGVLRQLPAAQSIAMLIDQEVLPLDEALPT